MSSSPLQSFRWRALSETGARQYGRENALNAESLMLSLQQRGLRAIDIQANHPLWRPTTTLPRAEWATWVRQLATLTGAGIPVTEALELSHRPTLSAPLRRAIVRLVQGTRAGTRLSVAMASLDPPIDAAFVAAIRGAEHSGDLAMTLDVLADQAERAQALRAGVMAALMYPTAVLAIALAALIGMLVGVVPAFEVQFQNWNVPLPGVTQGLLWMSRAWQAHAWEGLAGIALVWLMVRTGLKRYASWRLALDHIKLKLPVMGALHRQMCVSRFGATLSMLHQAGVGLLDAVDVAGQSTGNIVYQRHAGAIQKALAAGIELSVAMASTQAFPDELLHLCRVGEQTGQLGGLLQRAAALLDQKTQTRLGGLTSLIEPILVTLLGCMIGAMVMALYLPIFQLGNLL